jgi:hypothetical protein
MKLALDDEVKFEDVYRAHVAREGACDEYEREYGLHEEPQFQNLMAGLVPRLYDEEISKLCRYSRGAGEWLADGDSFIQWRDSDDGIRKLWFRDSRSR